MTCTWQCWNSAPCWTVNRRRVHWQEVTSQTHRWSHISVQIGSVFSVKVTSRIRDTNFSGTYHECGSDLYSQPQTLTLRNGGVHTINLEGTGVVWPARKYQTRTPDNNLIRGYSIQSIFHPKPVAVPVFIWIPNWKYVWTSTQVQEHP